MNTPRSLCRPSLLLAILLASNSERLAAGSLPPPNAVLLSGTLKQANAPAQGDHDFRFQIFNAETGGQTPPGARTITVTQPVIAGAWQTSVDLRQFGAEVGILDDLIHAGQDLIPPAQGYGSILDSTVRPPQGWVSILDDTFRPPMGSRSILDNTFHTATALNWRASQGTWLEISVRKKGNGPFVPLVPRQRLTAVPGAIVAQTANHALVAGTVTEGGVDTKALAPRSVTADKLSLGAITTVLLSDQSITAPKLANATVVRSINGLQDDITLVAGSGLTLLKSGHTLTLSASGVAGGGGGTPLPGGNFLGVDNDNKFGSGATFGVIVGGQSTKISDDTAFATLGGGQLVRIYERASWAVVGGGYNNVIDRDSIYSSLLGGRGNRIGTNSPAGALLGGDANQIADNSSGSFLGGGQINRIGIGAGWSVLNGGYNNAIEDGASNGVIGGGYANLMRSGSGSSTIAGGNGNTVNGSFATIGGGGSNSAGPNGTVAGGGGNRATGTFSAVGGGSANLGLSDQATIAGGLNNIVDTSIDGTIGGGGGNHMTNAPHGTIAGGDANTMFNGYGSLISGGLGNTVIGPASAILGGEANRIETLDGYATILGGSLNRALGSHSLAAGRHSEARHVGSFVWNAHPGRADNSAFVSEQDGEFAARAYGGFRLLTEGTEAGHGDIRLDAGNASLLESAQSGFFSFTQGFSLVAGGGVNVTTGGRGLFVDGQRISGANGGPTGTGSIVVSTGGGQTDPQARFEQTNPDDYVRLMMNTPRSFWTLGTGPDGAFGFYVPGQSPANTTGDNGAHRFLITANGEVGVGSERPLAQFHVRGRGGFNLPQIRATQQNPQDFARLRLETGNQGWDVAAGPDGSLRFYSGGSDRLILGTDGVQLTTGAAGFTVNGRTVAYVDQLGQGGGGQPVNGGAVTATVAQGAAITATTQDTQAGIAVNATGRVAIRGTSSSPQGAAIQGIQLNGLGYAGEFSGRVKVASTVEANGGLKIAGGVRVSGIGDNTPTAAFRLIPDLLPQISGANPGGITTRLAVLDHPSLNGNPDAVLMLTPVNASAFKLYQRSSDVMRGDFLYYLPDNPSSPAIARGRWVIDVTRTPPPFGQPDTGTVAIFNALVVAP